MMLAALYSGARMMAAVVQVCVVCMYVCMSCKSYVCLHMVVTRATMLTKADQHSLGIEKNEFRVLTDGTTHVLLK